MYIFTLQHKLYLMSVDFFLKDKERNKHLLMLLCDSKEERFKIATGERVIIDSMIKNE